MSVMFDNPRLQASWIAPWRSALLLIDMQRDFAAPDGEMARKGFDVSAAQAALGKAEALAAAARRAGVPCLFARFLTAPGREHDVSREARLRRGDHAPPTLCLADTVGAAFVGPQPRPGEAVLSKYGFSAFSGTGLAERLQADSRDTLVMAGLTTECCVQSSAWDAFERHFHVLIARDACAAYEPDLHDGALKALAWSGAILADTEEFVAIWT